VVNFDFGLMGRGRSLSLAGSNKSLQSSSQGNNDCSRNGSMLRLLLRPRSGAAHGSGHSTVRDSRRLARRLVEQVAGLKSGGWTHLTRLSIDVAELQCGYDPEEVLRHIREGFGAELEFAEVGRDEHFPFGPSL
jgi:hypothetical protein